MSREDNARLIVEFRELLASRAWAKMCESMDQSALNAAYKLGDRPGTLEDTNFTRGAVWALQTLKRLPNNILTQLQNDAVLEERKGDMNDSANA